ncbi:MAG TPA: glucosaminidase domain-containing protein [Cytophagaceae bacterium]|jgi:hypothetical protein|nr:glucosaminidase domain-containing protein [Cytophagaceae bacterium]
MVQKFKKRLLLIHLLLMLLFVANSKDLYAQGRKVKEASRLYESLRTHKIAHAKTVLAIVIYETGWMQCKSCALDDYNNLFGFRTNKDFIKFSSITESIKYLKKWQTKYYKPWKVRHPQGTYYEYLKYIRYCDNMDNYIRTIKSIEGWIALNIEKRPKVRN